MGGSLGCKLLRQSFPCDGLSLFTLSHPFLALKLGLRFGCSLVCFETLLFKLTLCYRNAPAIPPVARSSARVMVGLSG